MIETARLVLRPWRDDDVEPFAAMGQDPEVMACFPGLLDRDATEAMVARVRAHFEREGFGPWAVEAPGVAPFLGFAGPFRPQFTAHFTPCVEIGWRFARRFWGAGYAIEAAQAALDYGFGTLGLAEIVAFLIPANTRSARVCERLGMHRDPADDFDHPSFAPDVRSLAGHPQCRHVLYRKASARR
jgi:RimJ/RimL family protein N-acetyltransferase